MKHFLSLICVIAFLCFLSSCSSIQTSYDLDKTVDFTKFKTYAYSEEALKLPVDDLNRNRIITAVDKELAARGLTKSSSPDVWVDLQLKTQQMESATATTTGGYGGYGYGRMYGYGGGMGTTHIDVNKYVDGTLFINVINDNKLVWQGRGTKTIDETASPTQRDKNITSGVSSIFYNYPVKKLKK